MTATITVREVSLTEAATVLNLTPEAVRMRWRRGKLKGRRDGSRILIELEGDRAPEQPTGQDRTAPGQGQIVEVLQAQVTDLQKRLDEAQQAQAEMRRLLLQSQAQVAEMTKRLPALPAPGDETAKPVEETQPAKPERKRHSWRWPWSSS